MKKLFFLIFLSSNVIAADYPNFGSLFNKKLLNFLSYDCFPEGENKFEPTEVNCKFSSTTFDRELFPGHNDLYIEYIRSEHKKNGVLYKKDEEIAKEFEVYLGRLKKNQYGKIKQDDETFLASETKELMSEDLKTIYLNTLEKSITYFKNPNDKTFLEAQRAENFIRNHTCSVVSNKFNMKFKKIPNSKNFQSMHSPKGKCGVTFDAQFIYLDEAVVPGSYKLIIRKVVTQSEGNEANYFFNSRENNKAFYTRKSFSDMTCKDFDLDAYEYDPFKKMGSECLIISAPINLFLTRSHNFVDDLFDEKNNTFKN